MLLELFIFINLVVEISIFKNVEFDTFLRNTLTNIYCSQIYFSVHKQFFQFTNIFSVHKQFFAVHLQLLLFTHTLLINNTIFSLLHTHSKNDILSQQECIKLYKIVVNRRNI